MNGREAFHPLMRVWIEIAVDIACDLLDKFHPLMRVWIEIQDIVRVLDGALGFTLL